MAITLDGTTGFSGNGTLSIANITTISSNTANTPPVIRDLNGTEIGKFCLAWVNFIGSNGAIRSSFNVSSVTYSTTGTYIVNFANAMPNANYCFTVGIQRDATGAGSLNAVQSDGTGVNSGNLKILTSFGTTPTLFNPSSVSVAIFR